MGHIPPKKKSIHSLNMSAYTRSSFIIPICIGTFITTYPSLGCFKSLHTVTTTVVREERFLCCENFRLLESTCPLIVCFISQGGALVVGTTAVLEFDTAEASYVFEDVSEKPVPSILREFSAPVKLEVEGQTEDDLLFLFANDSDPFNRYLVAWKMLSEILV